MIKRIEIESTRLQRRELLIDSMLVVITGPAACSNAGIRRKSNGKPASKFHCHARKPYRVNTARQLSSGTRRRDESARTNRSAFNCKMGKARTAIEQVTSQNGLWGKRKPKAGTICNGVV